jgi:hypothetical protein
MESSIQRLRNFVGADSISARVCTWWFASTESARAEPLPYRGVGGETPDTPGFIKGPQPLTLFRLQRHVR